MDDSEQRIHPRRELTLHLSTRQIEVFCETVPKTAEVGPIPLTSPRWTEGSLIVRAIPKTHTELSRLVRQWTV